MIERALWITGTLLLSVFFGHLALAEYYTVALRVSPHPRVQALCQAVGGPIVSTSANLSGARAARHLFQVYRQFGGGLDYVLSGALGGNIRPSAIRDLRTDAVLRPG